MLIFIVVAVYLMALVLVICMNMCASTNIKFFVLITVKLFIVCAEFFNLPTVQFLGINFTSVKLFALHFQLSNLFGPNFPFLLGLTVALPKHTRQAGKLGPNKLECGTISKLSPENLKVGSWEKGTAKVGKCLWVFVHPLDSRFLR